MGGDWGRDDACVSAFCCSHLTFASDSAQSLYLRAYYTSAGTRWNVIRYPLASHFIFYWSLQRRYFDWSKSQFKGMDPGTFDDLIDKTLLPKGVLIAKEAHCLKKYAGASIAVSEPNSARLISWRSTDGAVRVRGR